MTEVEDGDDSLSLSIGDIFQDNFSSSQMDNENIEKLLLECENDMRDDNKDNIKDITEIEDKIAEPNDEMTKKVKELEDKYRN